MHLWSALTSGASEQDGLSCWTGAGYEWASWKQIARDAEQMTAGLRRLGVGPGVPVAAVLTNSPLAVRGILAIWLAGGTLASLPVIARGMSTQEHGKQLRGICEQLGPVALLCDRGMLPTLTGEADTLVRTCPWESLVASGSVESSPPGQEGIAFIQYSSGSTRRPKGCMLSTSAIEAQIDLLENLMEPSRGAVIGYSWLPLSHDMGMFGGLLSCWSHSAPFILSTPKRFMFAPSTWLTDASRFGATITGGPDTALRLASRALRPRRLHNRLRLRICIVGAERVHAETLKSVTAKLEPYGFRLEVLMPAYGMAEAVVAVTGTPCDQPPRHLVIDALALADGEVEEVPPDCPSATRIVSAGRAGLGVELHGLSPVRISEIRVRSPSLAQGYLGEPQLTQERFQDGQLLTGDLGFMRDGHLYPVGRIDDMISVAGRSVYTGEIETAVHALQPVRDGTAALIESPDSGRPVLVMELRRRQVEHRALAEECAGITLQKAGIALDRCLFLARGSLPKTPSDKIQRHRCRQLLALNQLQPLAVVELNEVGASST